MLYPRSHDLGETGGEGHEEVEERLKTRMKTASLLRHLRALGTKMRGRIQTENVGAWPVLRVSISARDRPVLPFSDLAAEPWLGKYITSQLGN